MMKACLKIIKFLHPFKSSDNEFEEIKILQDIIYSLAIKITTKEATSTNIRNFIFILSSMIRNIEHHLVLSRETPQDKYFDYILTMIRTIRNLFFEDKPDYLEAYDLFIFEHLKDLLQSSSRAKNIGGIKLISELYEVDNDTLIVENCAELIHLCFSILNKLPGRFCYEIQAKTKELAWKLIQKFMKREKEQKDGVARSEFKSLKSLMTKLLPLVFNVNIHLQKLSIELFND
jgi:hypothetical protein